MKVGSLFSGIGGFELGLSMASPDFEIAWQVENEPYARRVLEKHWPDVPRWDDVKTFPPDPVEDWEVDMICGGFPCQPVSSAGSKLGQEDDRYLWSEMARVCKVLRPRWILAENVARIISAGDQLGNRGGLLGGILRDLASLGYHAEWHCLPASSFGARHIRDRFWLIGWLAHPLGERGCGGESGRKNAVHVDSRRQIVGPRGDCGWWATEPELGRVADGIPSRMDRNNRLGNAVVPHIVAHLARAILEVERDQ